jgi:ribonuclease R
MPKKPAPQDPHAAREAEKYDRPIPSREFILDLLEKADGPMNHAQLCRAMELEDHEQVEALRRRLAAMERDAQLMRNRRGAYCPIAKIDLVRGIVQGHRDGFGFVIPAEGGGDFYLSSREMGLVFDGDEVLVRESGVDRRGRREGAIVEVVKRNTSQIVGRFFQQGSDEQQGEFGIVVPENSRVNHDIHVGTERMNAQDGQYVMVAITEQPARHRPPKGRVVEVLGDHMAPGMEVDVAIRSYAIPHEWPAAVEREAQALEPEPLETDKQNRIDIRHLNLVTIDGEDARDFDDAVYCEPKKGGGWRLWVAIADVSHYVKVGSALDTEAQLRGNSVYFPNRVVPMLPEALSNGLCSLKPKVDRLCMVCEMTISAAGKLSGYRFFEGVMHSKARLTYTKVAAILDPESAQHETLRAEYRALVPDLENLHALYKTLRAARDERGAIDFETVETRVIWGADRKIDQIVPVVRNDAHKLIEECMLIANVATAKLLEKLALPALYRVHEGPNPEKLKALRAFLGELGLNLRGGDKPSPGDYQQVLAQIEGRPDANVIQTVMLRSLSQARYQADNEGHFGLHYPAYTHFTSPIRRYPDLLVHRAIRFLVRGGGGGKGVMGFLRGSRNGLLPAKGAEPLDAKVIYPYERKTLDALGEQCSMTERRADEATRDVMAWLKCEYLQDRVGEVFEGVVSAVTNFGLFVELKDVYVEGLVHISALESDYYHFDAAKHRLVGERSSRSYQLGDDVTVQVARVDLDDRKIDLELVASATRAGRRARKAGAPAGARDGLNKSPVSTVAAQAARGRGKAGGEKSAAGDRGDKGDKGGKPGGGRGRSGRSSRRR